jgi:putative heme-binding domain-containing protein
MLVSVESQNGFDSMHRMKLLRSALVLLICLALFESSLFAQSLSQRLKTEPTEKLAAAARKDGSAVRGAILFTQRNLNCTRCHGSGDAKLLGPDLTQLGNDATDVYLVEALLNPSKVIRKGFESVIVVTKAGKPISGRIVEQTADKLAIRVSSDDLRLVTLAKADIEEIAPNKVSSMPEKLVDELKDRRQFLDLVRYMMELAAAGKTRKVHTHSLGGKSVREELQGIALIKEFNCTACHNDQSVKTFVSEKRAPDLSWSGARINPRYIQRFIANPLHVKPGTTMPDVMAGLSKDERQTAAEQITHFLVSASNQRFQAGAINAEVAARGREVFHTVGCVACHSPRNNDNQDLLADSSVALESVEQKYNVDGLVEFLKDPLKVRPSGRMPKMQLTHWEAIDVANYLLSKNPNQSDEIPTTAFKLNSALATKGKAHFGQLGCRQCHKTESTKVSFTSKPLSQVAPNEGCLSGKVGKWPKFGITSTQRKAIQVALARKPTELSDDDQISLTLSAFRCLNCHQRDELGGVSSDRNPHFQTTNPNLGPQGRIPPTLTGVGAKLNAKWMRQVLVNGRAIRPYVKTRMPQYGADNVGHLVELLQRTDELPDIKHATFTDQKKMRQVGAELVGTGSLNCIVCHTFQLKKAANMSAVDLTEMAERLQKDWFYHYLRDPQRLSMNTVMPSFWPGGRAMRKDILDGDTNMQIEALWQYLLDGRQARTPRGLIREPMELLATDEAVMLRRKYPGIGKRGIGVGYPHQVNIAFDAEQMRLASIWKGKFADPGGVWRSQGHGTVRPLGHSIIQFPAGPELDDAKSPWTVGDGRPPQHRFKGYSLDDKQRPKFSYQFADITVLDYPIDVLDSSTKQPIIRRTLTFRNQKLIDLGAESADRRPKPRKTLRTNTPGVRSSRTKQHPVFRVANGKSITSEGQGVFLVDKSLRVRIDSKHTGQIVDVPTGKQLRITLDVSDTPTTLVLEYVW